MYGQIISKKSLILFLSFIIIIPCISGQSDPGECRIIDKPIIFNSLKKELTKEYAKLHYGTEIINIKPVMIVIHSTGSRSLINDFNTLNDVRIKGRKYLKKYGEVNVSAHYLIDRDGTIYRLMPDNIMARHVIGLNHCSIGIENTGINDLTEAQIKANETLIRYLVRKYPEIKYLIGHFEYRKFEGTDLFIEKHPDYRTAKTDPSKYFMNRLRSSLKDISLK